MSVSVRVRVRVSGFDGVGWGKKGGLWRGMEGGQKIGEVKNGGVGRAKSWGWGWGLGVHSVSQMDLG